MLTLQFTPLHSTHYFSILLETATIAKKKYRSHNFFGLKMIKNAYVPFILWPLYLVLLLTLRLCVT